MSQPVSVGADPVTPGATPPSTEKRKNKKMALGDGQGRLAAFLISPTMIVIFVVVFIPILMSLRESVFLKNDGVNPETGLIEQGEKFVGLRNYVDAFGAATDSVTSVWGTMPRMLNAFINNMYFTVVCVSIETVLGVAMALIMAKAFKGRGVVRAAILVPWAIPTIVSAMMWKLIFDSQGVANKIIGHTVLWLGDSAASQWAVIIADVWKTAPFIGLLTLAGLQTIPDEVYEAAKVDGANRWQSFVRITLPMVKPALVVAVLFRTLDTMRMFDLPYGMIGANKYSVETLSVFAYQEAQATRYGPAAAYSIMLFLLIVIVAFVFIKLLGADVVSDPEVTAQRAQRKRMRKLHRQARRGGSGTRPTTSGEYQS